jgi:hypothetical protein
MLESFANDGITNDFAYWIYCSGISLDAVRTNHKITRDRIAGISADIPNVPLQNAILKRCRWANPFSAPWGLVNKQIKITETPGVVGDALVCHVSTAEGPAKYPCGCIKTSIGASLNVLPVDYCIRSSLSHIFCSRGRNCFKSTLIPFDPKSW